MLSVLNNRSQASVKPVFSNHLNEILRRNLEEKKQTVLFYYRYRCVVILELNT